MSNASRKARRARNRQRERDAVATACAVRGCTCRPDIEHYRKGGLNHVDVQHDDDCPAVDTGSMLIVGRGHNQSSREFARNVVEVLKEMGQ